MKSTKIKFDALPDWTYAGADAGIYTFCTALCLAKLGGKWVRLTADTQRKLLGFPVFGKQSFKYDIETGNILVARKVCFGTDCEIWEGHYTEIRDLAYAKKKIVPGS